MVILTDMLLFTAVTYMYLARYHTVIYIRVCKFTSKEVRSAIVPEEHDGQVKPHPKTLPGNGESLLCSMLENSVTLAFVLKLPRAKKNLIDIWSSPLAKIFLHPLFTIDPTNKIKNKL